ncbi:MULTISPECIES: hypothetical protein [unclassified Microcoleus]|nr:MULTISPECIES: hypothetical protein [unclassified Microcoleus]
MRAPPAVYLKLDPSSFGLLSCIVLVKMNVVRGTVDRPLRLKIA